MEKIIADFCAKSTIALEGGEKRIEDFENSRVILTNRRLVVASNRRKIVVNTSSVFDVNKLYVPEDLKDVMMESIKLAFFNNNKPNIIIIKSSDKILEKFLFLLLKTILGGSRVIYKYPAIKGGVVLNTKWKDGILNIARKQIIIDEIKIKLSSVRDIRKDVRLIKNKQVEIINVRVMEKGESIVSYLHIPDKRIFNLFGRYISFEYLDLLMVVEKANLSIMEKRVLQTLYSGLSVEDLPSVLGLEVVEVNGVLMSLEKKKMMEKGKLTPYGEVAVSRYMEEVNT